MLPLLRVLPVLALFLAGIECWLVRRALPWRAFRPELFLHAAALWAALGLVACVPAFLSGRWLARRSARRVDAAEPAQPSTPAPLLLGWMALPVLLHSTLDRHVGLDADLSGLAHLRPWSEVFLVLGAGGLVLLGLARALARLRPILVAAPALVLALGLGFTPPGRPTPGAAAPPARGPNVLLLVWDTTRSDRLQPYGYARTTTPNLERFAREALLFEDSLSPATFTLSSHLSLLTGVLPSTHGSRLCLPGFEADRATSVAEAFQREGWRTGAFVGTDVLAGRTGIRRGFEVYDDEVDPLLCETRAWRSLHDLQSLLARLAPGLRRNGEPHWIQDFQRPAAEVLARARAWIDDGDARPWFCFVNLYDAHWPYLPRAEGRALVSAYDGPVDGYFDRSDAWTEGYAMSAADARHLSELYEGELFELDRAVDGFLRAFALERGGTAVVLTADHGEAFGELGRFKHEDVIEPQVRVPLLVRLPEPRPLGRRVEAPVSGIDVGPTLLALAGLAPLTGMEGASLLSEIDPARVRYVEDRDHLDPTDVRIALYRGPWKLVRRGLGGEARYELFDLAADPAAGKDVSAEHSTVQAELEELLEQRRERFDAEERSADGPDAIGDALRGLGYTE